MKSGYSHGAIDENARILQDAGLSPHAAIAEAMSAARHCFFKRYPHGALPYYLAFPKQRRLAADYDEFGKPRRNNPAARASSSQLQKAARRYHAFTGHDNIQAKKITIPAMPKAVLTVGECDGILYTTIRDGVQESYQHKFAKGSRPLLAASPDGKRLFLLGGAFNFTERGIVDKPQKPRR